VLEKVHGADASSSADADATSALTQVMSAALASAGGRNSANKAQMLLMQKLMEQMFVGGSVPTLRSIIGSGRSDLPKVRETTNIREASVIMTEHRKGLLVMDADDELVGIITPKDILNRVIAAGKSPDITAVSSVMTPNPDCVTAELTLLDALREMYEHKYLHLPVRDEASGRVIGLVDVMELVCSTAGGSGGKGWRDFFSGAMAVGGDGDVSETASTISAASEKLLKTKPVPIRAKYLQPPEASSDVFSLSLAESKSGVVSGQYKYNSYEGSAEAARATEFDFKVTDCSGLLHKIRSSTSSLSALRAAVATKLSVPVEQLLLKYVDEEGDEVVISSDGALADAVQSARNSGAASLKLHAVMDAIAAARITQADAAATSAAAASAKPAAGGDNTMMFVAVGGVVVAVAAVAAFVLTRKNK
jgi:CBS domain-containing protein